MPEWACVSAHPLMEFNIHALYRPRPERCTRLPALVEVGGPPALLMYELIMANAPQGPPLPCYWSLLLCIWCLGAIPHQDPMAPLFFASPSWVWEEKHLQCLLLPILYLILSLVINKISEAMNPAHCLMVRI